MRGSIVNLINILRWDGPLGVLGRVRELLGWRTYLWLARTVDAPAAITTGAGLAIREIDANATASYLALRPNFTRAEYEQRLRSGQRCFAVEADGQMVAVSWLTLSKVKLHALGQTLVLAPGDVCVFNSFVDPAWRGHRLHHLLINHLLMVSRNAGARRLCCFVSRFNRRSVRSLCGRERPGFSASAVLTSVNLGPIHRQWVRGEFQGKLIGADRPRFEMTRPT